MSFVRATSRSPSSGREEEAAVLLVGEELDREQGEPPGLVQPAEVAGRDVELDQAVRDVGVVVEEARRRSSCRRGSCGASRPPSRESVAEQERRHLDRRRPRSRRARAGAPASARAASASPFQEATTLSSRNGCSRPARERERAQARLLVDRARARCSGRARTSKSRSWERPTAVASSGVQVNVRPSTPVGVSVLGRRDAAALDAHLAQEVVERQLDDPPVALLPVDGVGVEVGAGEQRVVVQHLLEVRHEPAVVDRVAMEAAADHVPHAARGHARRACARPSPRASSESRRRRNSSSRGRRELRGPAEAAEGRLEGARRRPPRPRRGSPPSSGSVGRARASAEWPSDAAILEACSRSSSRWSPTPPRRRSRSCDERRHPVARLGREVRAGVERAGRRA